MNFNTIKSNFDKGLWTKSMVKMAVKKGVITSSEYAEITNESYDDGLSYQEAMEIILGND